MSHTKICPTYLSATATKLGKLLYFHGQITGNILASRGYKLLRVWIIARPLAVHSTPSWTDKLRQHFAHFLMFYGHQTRQVLTFLWEAYRKNISWPRWEVGVKVSLPKQFQTTGRHCTSSASESDPRQKSWGPTRARASEFFSGLYL